jgi:hypothetical protein
MLTFAYRADAIGYDVWEEKFKKFLDPDSEGSLGDLPIISKPMEVEFRKWRRIVLQPGGGVASHMGLLRTFLGREPNIASYIEHLREPSTTAASEWS